MLFPGGRLPLRLFEQRYLQMAKACLKDGSPFGVCLIREGGEVGAPATPASVGTVATIASWDMAQLGVLSIVARGERRFRITEHRVQPDGLAVGRVEPLAAETDAPVPDACRTCLQLLERIHEQHPELLERPHRMDSALWVGARLAELLPLPLFLKQELLELDDGRVRLERINALLKAA